MATTAPFSATIWLWSQKAVSRFWQKPLTCTIIIVWCIILCWLKGPGLSHSACNSDLFLQDMCSMRYMCSIRSSSPSLLLQSWPNVHLPKLYILSWKFGIPEFTWSWGIYCIVREYTCKLTCMLSMHNATHFSRLYYPAVSPDTLHLILNYSVTWFEPQFPQLQTAICHTGLDVKIGSHPVYRYIVGTCFQDKRIVQCKIIAL